MNRIKKLSFTAKVALAVILTLGAASSAFSSYFYFGPIYLTTVKPVQPIAFSHKLHAGTNKIPCMYCHTFARRSEMSGIPSAEKCMNCHEYVKVDSPKIKQIASHVEKNTPIEWFKVFALHDHVWFNHKRHIKRGLACQKCHGPIETMDVVYRTNDFKMGFCLGCHQKNGAPTDCWTCHT